jgi:uncharacterized coiled-coil protein SlyX
VSGRLDRNIGNLESRLTTIQASANEQAKKIAELSPPVTELQNKVSGLSNQYTEAQNLVRRWQEAVEVVTRTSADQTFARTIWLVLRNDAWVLLGSFGLSLVAFIFALLAFFRSRRNARV